MESQIEEKILNDLLVWIKDNQDLSKEKLEAEIIRRIKEQNYLKEDWHIQYAKERIKNEIIKIIKSKKDVANYGLENRQDLGGWGRHFTIRNIIINGLIALFPASLIIGILRELGIGGAIIIWGVIFGLMYLIGVIREKIKRLSS